MHFATAQDVQPGQTTVRRLTSALVIDHSAMELGVGGAWLAWAAKCCLVGTLNSLAASYVFATAKTTAPGMSRLRRWWPVLVLFTLTPLVFTAKREMLSRACCAAVTLWLANFKLLLLMLGRGPLSDTTLSAAQFKALLLFPVLQKEGPDGKPLRITELPDGVSLGRAALQRAVSRLPENLLVLLVASYTLVSPRVPIFFKTYSGAFGVHAFAAIWSNLCAAWVMWRHGLQAAITWDRPWLQNSLSDFWSRRWNMAAAYTLRSLIFEPIMEGKAVRKVDKESTQESPVAPATTETKAANRQAAAPGREAGAADKGGLDAAAAAMMAPAGPAELVDVEVIHPPHHKPQFKATVVEYENGAAHHKPPTDATAGASAAAAAAAASAAAAMMGPSEIAAEPAGPGSAVAVADTMEQAIAEAETLAHNRHQAQDAKDYGDVQQSGRDKRAAYSFSQNNSQYAGTGESSGMDSNRAQRGSSVSETDSFGSHDLTVQLKASMPALPPKHDAHPRLTRAPPISEEQDATVAAAGSTAPKTGSTAPSTDGIKTPRGKRVPASRRLLALALTFAVSGLMHEVLLLVCTGWSAYRPSMGRQLLYFMLQVPTSIIEQQLARTFKKAKWTPPDAIAIPFTSLSLQVPGLFLFWSPIFNAASAAMAKW